MKHSPSYAYGDLKLGGQARRTTGQKKGVWNAQKNANMLRKLDSDSDGKVDMKAIAHDGLSWIPL